MDQSKQAKEQQPISRSNSNLARWVHHQLVMHLVRGPIPGATLKIALARKALIRQNLPDKFKESLLKEVDWMLRQHAEAAKYVAERKAEMDERGFLHIT